MYLFVFVGLAWLLTAPAMAVLLGKVFNGATDGGREDFLLARLETQFRDVARRTATDRS